MRGGDALIATVEDDDVLAGMNANFQNATLDFEAMQLLGGGSLVGTSPNYTGYVPPTLAQEKSSPRLPLKVEIYAAEYAEGSQDSSDVAGYVKVTLWNAKGRIPTFTQQDRNFAVPSYTIKSRENKAQSKPAFTIDKVANLPS